MIQFDFRFANHTVPTTLNCFLLLILVKSEILATILKTLWTWNKVTQLFLRMLFSMTTSLFFCTGHVFQDMASCPHVPFSKVKLDDVSQLFGKMTRGPSMGRGVPQRVRGLDGVSIVGEEEAA